MTEGLTVCPAWNAAAGLRRWPQGAAGEWRVINKLKLAVGTARGRALKVGSGARAPRSPSERAAPCPPPLFGLRKLRISICASNLPRVLRVRYSSAVHRIGFAFAGLFYLQIRGAATPSVLLLLSANAPQPPVRPRPCRAAMGSLAALAVSCFVITLSGAEAQSFVSPSPSSTPTPTLTPSPSPSYLPLFCESCPRVQYGVFDDYQYFDVPRNASYEWLGVALWGAGGKTGSYSRFESRGAFVMGALRVFRGERLRIIVGSSRAAAAPPCSVCSRSRRLCSRTSPSRAEAEESAHLGMCP